jgi:hypothetical protein
VVAWNLPSKQLDQIVDRLLGWWVSAVNRVLLLIDKRLAVHGLVDQLIDTWKQEKMAFQTSFCVTIKRTFDLQKFHGENLL